MPDHKRGYTKRNEGYQPSDEEMAENYERRAKREESVFDEAIQRALIQGLIDSCAKIDCRLHAGTTEPTHIHGLVSWKHLRGWMSVRKSLKTSFTKRLNEISKEVALSRGASRKHVINRAHFEYLMETYLPGHHGLAFYEDRGWVTQNGTKRKRRRKR